MGREEEMKYGIALATFQLEFGDFGRIAFHGKDIKENLKVIKQLGYDGIDLFTKQMSDEDLKDIKTTINKLNLEVPLFVAIFLSQQGVNLSDSDEKNRLESIKKFKEQINYASMFGSKMPLGFIRGNMKKDDLETDYQVRLADSLQQLSEFAEDRGVKIVFEPINHHEVNSFLRVDQSIAFLEKYHLDKLELLIDTYHMNIEESSIEDAIKMASSRIGHVHITDSNGRAPGDGHLDYKAILQALKDVDYEGFLSSESFPLPSSYENGKRGIEHLKKTFQSIININ